MLPYLVVFLASAGAVLAVTPLVRRLAIRLNAIDRPSDRKVHPKPTPTLGGLGILLGFLAGLGAAYMIPEFRPLFQLPDLMGTLYAGAVISAVGAFDDLRSLSAPAKVAGQVLAAGLLILNGVQLLFFWFPSLGVISFGADLAVPLTILWVLVTVNAVNLMDGLDGLAAGIVAIAAIAFFVYAFAGPSNFDQTVPTAALLSAIVAGAAIGFLPYNFYPAKIFMGDSGSMLLGVLLASATVSGVGRTIQPSGGDVAAFAIPVLIPAIVLAVPLLDIVMAVVRRLRHGRPVFAPDKEHIHHQLRDFGHTHRRAVLIMYYWSMLLAGSGLAVTFIDGWNVVGPLLGLAAILIAATVVPHWVRQSNRAKGPRRKDRSKGVADTRVGTQPP